MTSGTFSNLNLNRLLSLSASGTSIFLIDSLPFLKPFGVKQVLTLKPIIYLPYLSKQTDFPLCTLDICGFRGNFIAGSLWEMDSWSELRLILEVLQWKQN